MILQPVNDIARICFLKGIRNVVLSPGSRCAPLTLAFSRHGQFSIYTIPDERSAAFIAMGMAEQTQSPVVLVCTSGTAVLNYAPAIAEAYYRNLPLIVLTADRPAEWIEQSDGQTIQQNNVFQPHIKKSFTFPDRYDHPDSVWFAHRIVNEAINTCENGRKGPVHVNIPLREPFYPEKTETIGFTANIKVVDEPEVPAALTDAVAEQLATALGQAAKVLIVAGQQPMNEELSKVIPTFSKQFNIPVVGDIISNMHGLEETIRLSDSFLQTTDESLKPDLLITFGQSVISKNLKLQLRKYPPASHWHISSFDTAADPFQSLTGVIRVEPSAFFNDVLGRGLQAKNPAYLKEWSDKEVKSKQRFSRVFENQPFGEFEAVYHFLQSLSGPCHLHLSNSMPVRYANFVGLTTKQQHIKVHSNRGTSGIDGSSSTAVGISLKASEPNYLIAGDVSFFYDINAFWNNYLPKNLKILLLNNHGGGIFRLLPGSSQQPELEELFETKQPRTAERMAAEFGFKYIRCRDRKNLAASVSEFCESTGPSILEVETINENNQSVFAHFKKYINS